MLRIWGRTNSSNVQKVLWCCAELGLGHERIDAGRQFGVVDTPEYRRLNPNGLVPTIDDDGFVIWESNAIVRYLAGRYGAGGLCPEDLQARAAADRWMDWQVTTIGPPVGVVFLGLVRTPPEQRDLPAIREAAATAGEIWRIFDADLADKDYAAGDALTMGDIPLGVMAYRWYQLDVERPELPTLRAWYERLAARPAFREHVMLPLT
jgi:glutathione S-transferase